MDADRDLWTRHAGCFRNGHEQHLLSDQGDFDFGDLFHHVEAASFAGHYMNAFGSIEDMQAAQHNIVMATQAAGAI